ncbi:helix-turn-helix domain-containing protein [Kitasatospora sp. NPDC058032]|uniref:helix-turn-helix domain-containing protein n=1 Tax=Kitasatospora sp. NPDC058032 TaxID=3346307 RepID=UPI0036DC73BD
MNRKELDPDASPAAAFGAAVRALREERGWTQQGLGERTGFSAVHVSAVETGRKPPTERFARRLDVAFDTGERFERLWRRLTQNVLFEGFAEYLRSEVNAVTVRLFEINIVPGVLQTPAYARAYQGALVRRGVSTQQQADERTSLLLRRQERVAGARIHAVIDEGCLRRAVGSSQIMAEQLEHLESLAARPRITIQVTPFSLGEERPFAHPITLLTMSNSVMVGYGETQRRGFLERDPHVMAEWAAEYDQLQVEALPRAASIAFIREIRKGFEHG